MIKKAFENHSLSDKQKDELFKRIENSVESAAVEKAENENKRNGFLKYASIAAAVVLLTGITILIIHLVTPGQQIDVLYPPDSSIGSNIESDTDESSDNKPEFINPEALPLYKDSSVMDMEPQKYGYTGFEKVRFAEKSYEEYRFVVAGDFIRREEEVFEAYLELYVYKNDTLLGPAGKLDTGSHSMGVKISKADVDSFEGDFITIIPMTENGKSYPLVALTVSDIAGHYSSLYYGQYRDMGFKTMTSFFSVVNDVPFKFGGSCELATWFPDFEADKITVNGTTITDHRGWENIFSFENKTIHVGAIFYDDEKQKRLDNLLPFEDGNIPVYDGEMYLVQGMDPSPFADILIDEKTCGDYTFTLVSPMAKRTDMPDKYMTRWFHLIVSYKGRVLEDSYSAAVFDGAQYGMSVPKDYDFSSMLKVYTMKQNGIEYPLASVTYTDYEHRTDAGIKATSTSRFFTVRNGMGEWFTDSSADYKNLPSDVVQSGLSLKDSANLKRITFDFEKRKATVTELNDAEDIDIRQCAYYKDSAIYKDSSTAIGESEFVRFAEKEYVTEGKHGGNYKFIVGGKMEKAEDGAFNVSLNMYLYRNDNLAGVQNALSNGGFDFTVSADDIESFGNAVLDVKEFQYFGTPFPLAVVTAKPHSSILEDDFPSAGFTTVSNFFTVRATNASVAGAELALFHNGGTFYPDYTKNVTFRVSENDSGTTVMVDEKGWEVFFNPETLTAHITADKAYNLSIGIKGENYANKNLVMRRYPLIENEDILFTTDSNGKACFDSLLCGTYIITDEEGNNIIDDKSESITITFDNSKTEITIKGISKEDESRDVLSLPLYENSKLFGEDKYNTGVSENVRFAEVTYGDYHFIVAGELTRTTTDYYIAKPEVYVYKGEEIMKDFGELYTGEKDGSVKILVQNAKKFTDNMLSVKAMTQNGKEYPLVILAVKADGVDNYRSMTDLYSMDRDYTIPAFYSITDNGVPGMPYQFTGYEDINLYSPVLDENIIIQDNSITDGKEWTVAFDFEKRTASVIPEKVTDINITFKGNVSYSNKNFYLQEYTLTDKEKVTIPFTTDSNGKAHFDELPCLTYNIFDDKGNMILADPHGVVFRVFENNLEDVWIIY
ncbi:MAG: hypothetical protein J6D27_05500 [Ruminiclostridium sp.]|nr:hypothetical protein [Ruminiclostridium sp.]